jgi:hypothetical protein
LSASSILAGSNFPPNHRSFWVRTLYSMCALRGLSVD